MKSSPYFSIIIPSYNREKFILKSIQSVFSQSFKDYELIIVDDGSTDNTSEIVKEHLSDNVQYYYINNSERAAARNFGMTKARGSYITFLDSDDIYYPNYLANAFKCIQKFNQPVFYAQSYEIKNQAGKVLGVAKPSGRNYYKAISVGNFLSCMGVFVSKEISAKLKFNEDRDLSGSEDWEYWVRVMAIGKLHYSHRVCSSLIVHDERSVLSVSEQSLVTRKNLAMKYAFEDSSVAKQFSKYKSLMNAHWNTYISLHLMLDKQTSVGIKYFLQAIKEHPSVFFERRTLAIIRLVFQNLTRIR